MLPRRAPHLQLVLPLALASALGAYALGAKSLWLDEAFSIFFARLDWPTAWHVMVTKEANMMLYYGLLHYWVGLGLGEATVRSLSVIAAVACIIPFYFLGVHLYGARHALLASLLLAPNAFFIRYAQEARAYSLVLLLTTTSSLLFVRAIDRPTARRCVAYAAVSALAVYAHFFAVWVLAVQFVAVMFPLASPGRRLRLLAAQGGAAALVVPLAWFAAHRIHWLAWVPRPTRETLIGFGREVTGYGGTALIALYSVLCGLFVLGSWLPNIPPDARRRLRWSQGFLLTWLAVPVLGTFLFSRLVTPVFEPRFLIVSLAPLPLLAAGGVQMLRPAWLKFSTLAVLFALAARGLHTWYADMPKDDWPGTAAYVLAHGRPGDGLIFYPRFIRSLFEYYLLRSDSLSVEPVFPPVPWGNPWSTQTLWGPEWDEPSPLRMAHPQARPRVWVVKWGGPDPASKIPAWVPEDFAAHYCLEETRSLPSIQVRLYQVCVPL